MSSSNHTGVGIYNPEVESWSTYHDRFELFCQVRNVDSNKKVAFLLTEIGREVYGIVENLVSPEKPKNKTYKQLCQVLQQHFDPRKIVIAERFRFHKRLQQENESVVEFVAELRKLARFCEFGDFLEEALRDQLVCGLRNEQQQATLLAKHDLKLSTAIEEVQALEMATKQSSAIKADAHPAAVASASTSTSSGVQAVSHKSKSFQRGKSKKDSCHRCGGQHSADTCRFRTEECHLCKKRGHIARMCRSKEVKFVEVAQVDDKRQSAPPIQVTMDVDRVPVSFEVDTGAAVTLMSKAVFQQLFPQRKWQPCTDRLESYTGSAIDVCGKIVVDVQYGSQQVTDLPLFVVSGNGSTLLGRDWLRHVRLDWSAIYPVKARKIATVTSDQDVKDLLEKHKAVFDEGLGELKNVTAHLQLDDDATPVFKRPRSVPYATEKAIDAELDRLVEQGIAVPVKYSDWATPVVPVAKPDGSVRLCGDFKVTVNPSLKVDQHPLPKPDDLFATLNGGQQFSKLDLTQAYQQVLLDDESQEVVTINTHRGLYRLRRLPFGIASAPAIFQSIMEKILCGIDGVSIYLDDILITAPDRKTHLARLAEVLERLEEAGLRLKMKKCMFLQDEVEYLGFLVDATGIHATESKITAIKEAPAPTDVSEVRSFMGLVNYYGRFVPDLATVANPLNQLLKKSAQWKWTDREESSFQALKQKLVSSSVLVHYNPDLPVHLACDASPCGVGAVLSHIMPNGEEKPIAFASRTLTAAEINYSQIDREALGIVFGVQKFHMYLYGRKFVLVTDNKPLSVIIGPKRGLPTVAAMRLQRWALTLAAYEYTVVVKSSEQNANADCMSRLPVSKAGVNQVELEVASICQTVLQELPIAAEDVRAATEQDPVLSKVTYCVANGWPDSCPEEVQKFKSVREELHVVDGCVYRGKRVVIPAVMRDRILQELHISHAGMVRMKALARAFVWWPKVDADIEREAKRCDACQIYGKEESKVPVCSWPQPSTPWERIHVDYAGPLEGKMHLIIVDAYSKWMEVESLQYATSTTTIKVLQRLFSQFGNPKVLVSDNGTQFTSQEFEQFLKQRGVTHLTSAPYFPATNGAAERCVQTFKRAMVPEKRAGQSFYEAVNNFLQQYRATPHATTGESPAKLFLRREVRTRLALLLPEVAATPAPEVSKPDEQSKPSPKFAVGDPVYIRVYGKHQRWTAGTVESIYGTLSYLVALPNKTVVRRHTSQMKSREGSSTSTESSTVAVPTATDQRAPRSRRAPQRYGHD